VISLTDADEKWCEMPEVVEQVVAKVNPMIQVEY